MNNNDSDDEEIKAQREEMIQREQEARESARRMNFYNYQIECIISHNAHRKIMKAKYVSEAGLPHDVVIKQKRAFRKGRNGVQSLEREISVLQRLKGEKQFVQLFAQLQTSEVETSCLIMQFYPKMDLLSHTQMRKGFEIIEVRYILLEMISILQILQKHRVAHCDIQPDNILINDEGKLILGSFGLCQLLTQQNQLIKETGHIGCSTFNLQEIIFQHNFKGFDADIFSVGVTIFFAYSGIKPFGQNTDYDILFGSPNNYWKQMCKKSPNKSFQNNLCQEFQDLFMRMAHKNPSKRISLEEILVHPFLRKEVGNNEGFKKAIQMFESKNVAKHQTLDESSTKQ